MLGSYRHRPLCLQPQFLKIISFIVGDQTWIYACTSSQATTFQILNLKGWIAWMLSHVHLNMEGFLIASPHGMQLPFRFNTLSMHQLIIFYDLSTPHNDKNRVNGLLQQCLVDKQCPKLGDLIETAQETTQRSSNSNLIVEFPITIDVIITYSWHIGFTHMHIRF